MTPSARWLVALVVAAAGAVAYLGLRLSDLRDDHAALAAQLRACDARVPAALPPADLVRQFNQHYYDSRSWDGMSWLGVKTLQNPPDMWSLQEILTEVRPDYVIEAGTYAGGSAVYMAMVMEALGTDGKVLTIDIKPQTEAAEKLDIWKRRVELFTGSSTDPALVAQLAERVKGKRVLVMLDSDHSHDHVLKELNLYSPLVSEGSYVVVQDTNTEGPASAVRDYLPGHPELQVDRSREKFLLTFTPGGYLKKTRQR